MALRYDSQIDLACERFLLQNPLILDNFFHKDPFLGYLRDAVEEKFTGGRRQIESLFEYDGETAAAYDIGDEFDISERRAEDAFALPLQFYYGNITAALEDLEVFNVGPRATFKFLNTRFSRVMKTMGAQASISLWLNGSRAGYTKLITGMAEAVNDGTTASWDGQTYPNYGTAVRNGVEIGAALNSTPKVTGAMLTINDLEESHSDATIGEGEDSPNIGVTTYKGFSILKSRFQNQQRFQNTQDPKLNFVALQFNNSSVMRSRYVPGTYISGTSGSDVTKLANAFLNKTSKGVVTAYPTMASESLWWLNVRKQFMRFLVSNSKKFQFGFTGFKYAQANTKVAGQVLLACALIVRSVRHQKQMYGFTR